MYFTRSLGSKVQNSIRPAVISYIGIYVSFICFAKKDKRLQKIRFPRTVCPNQQVDWAQREIFDRADALEAFYRDGLDRIGGHAISPVIEKLGVRHLSASLPLA